MKVLHFYKSYYPEVYGGVAQVIRQLAEGGRDHGVESRVLTLTAGEPGEIMVDSHLVRRVGRLFSAFSMDFSLSALTEFKKMAREADLVHYHFPWPLADAAHFFAGSPRPSVVTYHSDIVAQKKLLVLYRPLMNRFLSRVSAIVATSPRYLATSPVLQRFRDKAISIPLGLATLPAPDAARVAAWRDRLGGPFFLFLGAFRYYKGLDYLLEALQGLDLPTVLAGDGPDEARLKAKAGRLGLKNLHFAGVVSQEEKAELLAACHAFVFPSHLRSEAFGLSLVEAAMFAKPLICCEIGSGSTYINLAGLTGLVVPPANPAALAEAMLTLWNDADLAAEMGRAAHARYEELFTRDRMVEAYLRLYRSLV